MIRPDPRYPAPPPGVARYSPTSIDAFLGCGYAWLLDRETPHRRSTVAMAIGSAVSKAAKADNDSKMRDQPLDLATIAAVAVAAYETETAEAEITAAPIEIGRGKDDAASAAIAYGREVSPKVVDLLEAESPFCIEIAPTIQVVGTPDFAVFKGPEENKAGKPWTQARVDRSEQLTAYDWGYEARYETKAERIALHSLQQDRRGWHAETFYTHRTDEDRARFKRKVKAVDSAVRAGNFLPASELSWRCSAKWCGHWDHCPLRPGGA